MTDTVKRVDGELSSETVDRGGLVAVQTPQAFRAAVAARRRTPAAATPPTTPRSSRPRVAGGGRRRRAAQPQDHDPRRPRRRRAPLLEVRAVTHPGRPRLRRASLRADGDAAPRSCSPAYASTGRGLAGHTDADAVAHAWPTRCSAPPGWATSARSSRRPTSVPRRVVDGAAGRGRAAVCRVRWAVVNVDIVITAEQPRLAPHLDAMARTSWPSSEPTPSCRSSRSGARASVRSGARKASRCGRSRSWSVRSDYGGLPPAGRLDGRAPSSHGGAGRTAAGGSPHSWDHDSRRGRRDPTGDRACDRSRASAEDTPSNRAAPRASARVRVRRPIPPEVLDGEDLYAVVQMTFRKRPSPARGNRNRDRTTTDDVRRPRRDGRAPAGRRAGRRRPPCRRVRAFCPGR